MVYSIVAKLMFLDFWIPIPDRKTYRHRGQCLIVNLSTSRHQVVSTAKLTTITSSIRCSTVITRFSLIQSMSDKVENWMRTEYGHHLATADSEKLESMRWWNRVAKMVIIRWLYFAEQPCFCSFPFPFLSSLQQLQHANATSSTKLYMWQLLIAGNSRMTKQ